MKSQTTQLLLEAAEVMASRASLTQALESLCEAVLGALPHNRVSVILYREADDTLEVAASCGDNPLPIGLRLPLDALSPAARRAFADCVPTLIDYDSLPVDERGAANEIPSRLTLDMPLIYDDRFVGVLAVDDGANRQEFSEDELAFARGIAAHAAVAVASTELLERQLVARQDDAERMERLAVQKEIADASSSSLELGQVAKLVVDAVQELLAAQQVQLRLVNATGTLLESAACYDETGYLQQLGPMPVDAEFETAAAFRDGRARLSEDVIDADICAGSARNARASGIRSYALLPVEQGDRPIGTFYVAWSEPREFSEVDVAFFDAVVAQLAAGLANARLYRDVQRRAEFGRVLAEVAAELAMSMDVEASMPDVLAAATEALAASHGVLVAKERGGWKVAAVHGLPAATVGEFYAEDATPTLAEVLRLRSPKFVPDANSAAPEVADGARRMGHASFVTCPILYRDKVIAALSIMWAEPHAALDDLELNFLSRLTFIIGVTEENVRLYESEHRIADALQEALLALPESVSGVAFAHAYHSATESTRVGGDFYDLFQAGDSRIGVTVGDVAGKGLDAAVLTSLVKNSIRAHSVEPDKLPGRILSLANEVVHRSTPPEAFATVFFGFVDLKDSSLTYASAGHTTGVVVGADGSVEKLPTTGPILGGFSAVDFGCETVELEPGDIVFVYTDGLTEAQDAEHGFYGEGRLIEVLSSVGGAEPAEVVETVIADVMRFSGNRLRDDLAILAVRPDLTASK